MTQLAVDFEGVLTIHTPSHLPLPLTLSIHHSANPSFIL